MEVLLFNTTNKAINYHSRISTEGEELKMVKKFVTTFLTRNKRHNYAVFIEPQLPSGYPDIVIAEYASMDNLPVNDYRNKLDSVDLKILFHILQFNSISKQQLQIALGFNRNEIERSILMLQKSGMINVSPTGNYVRKGEIKSFFRIKRIISIEAKIGKWHDVIEQSYANQWFSSQTYIMINTFPTPECIEVCERDGVGIIFYNKGDYKELTKSYNRRLPVSFMSLQFNEWIYKMKKGGLNE